MAGNGCPVLVEGFKMKFEGSDKCLYINNCFSCKYRDGIDFAQAARLIEKYKELVAQEEAYDKLPWYRKIFKPHPTYICGGYTRCDRIEEKLGAVLFVIRCKLSPKTLNKQHTDYCHQYSDRWPYDTHKDLTEDKDIIKTIGEYIQYHLDKKSTNG